MMTDSEAFNLKAECDEAEAKVAELEAELAELRKLKLYTQDNSWAGACVVIAESEEKAREILRAAQKNHDPDYGYADNKPLAELEIKAGTRFITSGDL